MSEPWYVTHARETGHATEDRLDYGMRCLICDELPPAATALTKKDPS